MSSVRRSGGAHVAQNHPPVVATFDDQDRLVDLVGDIDRFVGEGGSREELLRRLHDLRIGHEDMPDVIPAVELSAGRYADIHILSEEDSHHFVILDSTELMQQLRENQQAGNEGALLEDQRRRDILKRAQPKSLQPRGLQRFRLSSDMFAALVYETRSPLAQLAGHARLLEQRCKADPAAMRSIAAIQHAAVRLEALSTNGLIGMGELSGGSHNLDVMDLSQLAALLQDTFALQARGQGASFQVNIPAQATVIEIDSLALRQVLINLIIHALDGMGAGQLVVSFSVGSQGLEVEIACEPSGFSAEHFGALVTTDHLLLSNAGGSLGLAVSQQILRQLQAAVELVPRRKGGHELWIRMPLNRVGSGEDALQVLERPIPPALLSGDQVAVVAVEPVSAAVQMVELLVDLGVPVVAVQEAGRISALMREDAMGALILSSPFDGDDGHELLKKLELPNEANVLLLAAAEQVPGKMGWLRDRNCVQVNAEADRDTLHAALRTVLGG